MKTVKLIAFCVLLGVAILASYVFHWSIVEFAVAMLTLTVFWLGLEVSKLTDASGKTVRDNNAKIIRQIEQGRAVEPKHVLPTRLPSSDHEGQLFRDFADFANQVNHPRT
jgi:hypothetical protein